jgi:hypothetical protein
VGWQAASPHRLGIHGAKDTYTRYIILLKTRDKYGNMNSTVEQRVIVALEEQVAALEKENVTLSARYGPGSDSVEQKAKIAMMEVKDEIVQALSMDYGYKLLSSERMFGGLSSSNFRLTLEELDGGKTRVRMLKLAVSGSL